MFQRTSMFLAVGLVAGIATAASAQSQLDSVTGSRGTPSLGTILASSRTEVTIDSRTGKRTFPVNEIRKVQFGGEPRELKSARDSLGRDEIEQSAKDLEGVKSADFDRKEIRQDIEFYQAYIAGRLSLIGGGDKVKAVTMMRQFLEDEANSQSFHYFDGIELLGDLAVSLGNYTAALRYYDELAACPWEDTKMRADLLSARALYDSSKADESLTRYQKVLDQRLDTAAAASLKQLATVGKAECLAATNRADEGIKLLEKVIANNDAENNKALFGRTYNSLGSCYRAAGRPKDALMAYLRTHLLFAQEPEVHAEALYFLSMLWRDAYSNSDRAIRAGTILKSRYAGSKWAQK